MKKYLKSESAEYRGLLTLCRRTQIDRRLMDSPVVMLNFDSALLTFTREIRFDKITIYLQPYGTDETYVYRLYEDQYDDVMSVSLCPN